MKLNRLFAFFIGCATFISSLLVYLTYIRGVGFPDGFITELGLAERKLAYVFVSVSVVLGFCFVYLGAIGGRAKISKRFYAITVLYLALIVSAALVDYYFQSNLTGAGGG